MFVTRVQAAEIRGVNRSTILRWLAAGLPHTKVGNQVIIRRSDLDRFEPRPVGNPDPANNGSEKRKRRAKRAG